MRVSVVICTLNRAASLEATLQCLRHQRYDDFEVVVVNGPSTDDTEAVLAPWADRVRLQRCPEPNLSMSRNIGIRAAAGEIVAFIDDDALPDFEWLNEAIDAFDAEDVAGVGGLVFDHTGLALQYKYSASNRFGETASRLDEPYDAQCFPGSFQFPYLQGTNALFRRSALEHIGGFDETFDYYLDETDVCVRLIDAGFRLRQLEDAAVHHKFLPSAIRDHTRVVSNWFPIMKNQVYFSYRHALDPATEFDILEHSNAFLQMWLNDASMHEHAGRLPAGSRNRAAEACARALFVGARLGRDRLHLRLGPVHWPQPAFRRFPTVASTARRNITFVSSGYEPNMTGGIARFISDLAPALARRGHNVRVITKALGAPAVDLEDGVWVHRIEPAHAGASGAAPDVFDHINDFTTAAVAELQRIGEWSSHDLVYGPLWDVEVLGALRRTGLPIAVQVATPIAIAADMAGHLDDSDAGAAMRRLMESENVVLDGGDLFHANSAAVADTIRTHYVEGVDPTRWRVVHLGLVDHRLSDAVRPAPAADDELTVLFVGRFEVRKGIDTYLEAIERIAGDHPHVRFVAAGEDRPLAPGDPPYGESWLTANSDQSWIDRVRFEGAVDDARLHQLYAAADLVVLPSRYESFGLVMVEAMIHSRALISGDTSGIRDVVRNGVDGVLVEPGDVDALAAAMRDLLADPHRRDELGRAGRQRFVDAFHVDRFAARFEAFMGMVTTSLPDVAADDPRWDRRADGRRALRLTADCQAAMDVDRSASARVVIEVDGADAVVTIDDGSQQTVALAGGDVHRLPVSTDAGRVTVRVEHGAIALGGLIVVRGGDG